MTETKAKYGNAPHIWRARIDGQVVPALRARVVRLKNGNSHSYTPEKYANWKSLVTYELLQQSPPMFAGPVRVQLFFYLPRPKSCPKARKYPTARNDVDNLAKAIMDGINATGKIWLDDSQVCDLQVTKEYADESNHAGVNVAVWELR